MVEHRLAKARVASSNLVSRSIPPSGASRVGYGGWSIREEGSPAKARYPSGKGEVCKTFMRRFDPDPRLQTFRHDLNLMLAFRGGVCAFARTNCDHDEIPWPGFCRSGH